MGLVDNLKQTYKDADTLSNQVIGKKKEPFNGYVFLNEIGVLLAYYFVIIEICAKYFLTQLDAYVILMVFLVFYYIIKAKYSG